MDSDERKLLAKEMKDARDALENAIQNLEDDPDMTPGELKEELRGVYKEMDWAWRTASRVEKQEEEADEAEVRRKWNRTFGNRDSDSWSDEPEWSGNVDTDFGGGE